MPPKMPDTRRERVPVKKKHAPPSHQPVLDRSDIRIILYELANQLAPADLTALLQAESELRERATGLGVDGMPLLAEQLTLALDCLRDHEDGACPQIPYYTISLLAAAVSYFANELDVIPDFLPRVGRLDDAVVMALAYELARDGMRRYCAWKGRDLSAVLRATGPEAS